MREHTVECLRNDSILEIHQAKVHRFLSASDIIKGCSRTVDEHIDRAIRFDREAESIKERI